MQLHTYQRLASNQLVERTKTSIHNGDTMKDLYLKAITGAGKTVLMADYIINVLDHYKGMTEIAFVWMSIGTGGLHEQSYKALKDVLPADIHLYNSNDFRSQEYLKHNDLLVLNWETVNNMTIDGDTVTYENVIMKDGEQISLPRLLKQTHNVNTKIVMIIDEAHIGAERPSKKDAQRTTIIKREIKPDVIVNVTATPKFGDEVQRRDIIEVDTQDVIREGRIKKQVVIDDSLDISGNDKSFVEHVVIAAVKKQEDLRERYRETGNGHINPLAIIQIPNGKLGDEMKAFTEGVLGKLGYTYDKENLAEVVDKGLNMDTVKESDSNVSFLIAKQAVSTGWDAPRAQIWVKLRDTKSAVFDAQTLGRILRMPAGKKVTDSKDPNYKFFEDDALNYAYVYTDAHYSISTSEYKAIYPTRKVLKEDFKKDVLGLKLPKEVVEKEDASIPDRTVTNTIEELIAAHYESSQHDLSAYKIIVSGGSYAIDELEDDSTSITEQVFELNHEGDVIRATDTFLKRVCGSSFKQDVVFRHLRRNLQQHYGDDFIKIRRWILVNQDLISNALIELKRRADQVRNTTATRQTIDFTFPETLLVNEKVEREMFEKCAYTNQPVSSQETEKAFEAHIDSHPNVKWWIKNQDAGQEGVSIAYNDERTTHWRLFFPDYVIRFTDGTLGLYETKSLPDLKEDNTHAKERRFTPYLANLRRLLSGDVVGGIVYLQKNPITGHYTIVDENYPELKK